MSRGSNKDFWSASQVRTPWLGSAHAGYKRKEDFVPQPCPVCDGPWVVTEWREFETWPDQMTLYFRVFDRSFPLQAAHGVRFTVGSEYDLDMSVKVGAQYIDPLIVRLDLRDPDGIITTHETPDDPAIIRGDVG